MDDRISATAKIVDIDIITKMTTRFYYIIVSSDAGFCER